MCIRDSFKTVGEIGDEVGGIVQDIDASEAKVINGYIDAVSYTHL